MSTDGPVVARLGDVVTLQRGTTYKSRLLGLPGPVLLGLASIRRNGGFRNDSLQTYGGDSPARLVLESGDIYVSLKDVTQSADLLGAVARVPAGVRGRLTQDTVKLVFRTPDAPLDYIYWLLRTPQYREYCRAHSTGTTNLGLPREDFLSFPIPFLNTDRLMIVSLLNALDDKIELNNRMNIALEATASALFKSWFVDFDPVVAKRDGKPLVGVPTDALHLFPTHFEDSTLGPIPQEWRVAPLDTVADFLNGLALQNYPPAGADVLPVIKIADLRAETSVGADRCGGVPQEYVIDDGDVVFSWSGSLMVDVWCGGRGALNQHLFKVTSSKFPKWYYLRWVEEHLPEFQAIAADKATTMGHIRRFHLSEAKVLVPPERLLAAMTSVQEPLLDQVIHNRIESRTLGHLRDTLLGPLLSGEITVKAAEKTVAEVV